MEDSLEAVNKPGAFVALNTARRSRRRKHIRMSTDRLLIGGFHPSLDLWYVLATEERRVNNEKSIAEGFILCCPGYFNAGRIRGCAGSGRGERSVPACNPECAGKEHGCRRSELSARRQVTATSPCTLSVHLRLRALRQHSKQDR